jgi:RNA polymerase sigma-B factor
MATIAVQAPKCRRGEEDASFRRYRRTGDRAIRDALVERHVPPALHLARRYSSGSERAQVALLALVKAVDRFDPDKGAAFASFATPTSIGEIKRDFRDHGWAVRVPRQLQELSVRLRRATERLNTDLGRAPTVAELADALEIDVERVLDVLATATAHRPVALDAPVRARPSGATWSRCRIGDSSALTRRPWSTRCSPSFPSAIGSCSSRASASLRAPIADTDS